MAADRKELFARLQELGIPAITVEHPPMFTVEQSVSLRESIPGALTKNLFLTDKDGRMVLVVATDDTRVDLRHSPSGSPPDGSASARASCSKLCSVSRPARSRRLR